jgi:hypothetical protein
VVCEAAEEDEHGAWRGLFCSFHRSFARGMMVAAMEPGGDWRDRVAARAWSGCVHAYDCMSQRQRTLPVHGTSCCTMRSGALQSTVYTIRAVCAPTLLESSQQHMPDHRQRLADLDNVQSCVVPVGIRSAACRFRVSLMPPWGTPGSGGSGLSASAVTKATRSPVATRYWQYSSTSLPPNARVSSS